MAKTFYEGSAHSDDPVYREKSTVTLIADSTKPSSPPSKGAPEPNTATLQDSEADPGDDGEAEMGS